MDEHSQSEATSTDQTICHRCGAIRRRGDPAFYVVKIEAFAQTEELEITREDLKRDLERELSASLVDARGFSASELMDQVYRRMVLHLCPRCYRQWIEDPVARDG